MCVCMHVWEVLPAALHGDINTCNSCRMTDPGLLESRSSARNMI